MSFSFGGIMRTINGRNLDILEKVNKELLQEDVSYKEHKCEKCGKNAKNCKKLQKMPKKSKNKCNFTAFLAKLPQKIHRKRK
jgi:hypothetical protein